MNNKKGLGRGLGALLSIFEDEEDEVQSAPAQAAVPPAPVKPEPQAPVMPQYNSDALFQVDEPVPAVAPAPAPQQYAEQSAPLQRKPLVDEASGLELHPDAEALFVNGINEVPLELLEINPNQPRKMFDEVSLNELAESIKIHGIIQPLVVNALMNGKFLIIAGERRYRAAKIAGLKSVPCILKEYSERQIKEIALIENLQREDLNPIEAARAIKQLMDEYNFTQEVVADRIGKSRPTVTNMLRLLNLTPEVIAFVEQGLLSAGHAKPMIVILDKALQYKVAKTAIDKKMSVREVEKLVREVLRPKKPAVEQRRIEQSPELVNFGEELQRVFSTKVVIQGGDNRGRIVIDYFSKDDLDRIYDLIELLKNKKLTLQDLSNFNKRS